MDSTPSPRGGFADLELGSGLLRAVARLGLTQPTPIQAAAIPPALEGSDVIGIAQTGTGKTLAFGLPLAERLGNGQVGLVLAPTRELAEQIERSLAAIGLSCALLVGGAPIRAQVAAIRRRPRVLVATPGRLQDLMDQRLVDLRRVSMVVLDEADRMLDVGFGPAIRKILAAAPAARQTLLFSATMPQAIQDLAGDFLFEPVRVQVAPDNVPVELIQQELAIVPKEDKREVLSNLLDENQGTVLVFSRTRHGARKLAQAVRELGHTAAELHADRSLAQRRAALDGFRRGAYRVLVATDIAARGIDVKDIALVVNFDVPDNPEDYVHRIGRTGRAGAAGRSILMATPEQRRDVRTIEKLIKAELPISRHSREGAVASATRPRRHGRR